MENFTQQISCQIRIRKSKGKKSPVQMGNVYIQVMIDGKGDRVPLSINWPMDRFDVKKESLLPRWEGDEEECHRKNLYIKNEIGRANKLALQFYASEKITTHKEFKRALKRYASREDILAYMEEKKIQVVADGLVSSETGKKYVTVFNRLEKYMGSNRWKFNTTKLEDILKFDAWMRKQPEWSHNTVCGTMRVLHKFLELANEDGIPFNNPMDGYKMPSFSPGEREILEDEDIKTLKKHFSEGYFSDHEHDVVLRYLLACYTGLRKSDIEQFDTRIHLKKNVLRLDMFKTRRYGKTVEFCVPKYALELIGNRRGKLFAPMESALLNKTLRKALAKVGISTYIKFHSGRDWFATTYLRLGGNLKDLQEILGHASIKTTEIYLKMNKRGKDDIIAKFDDIAAYMNALILNPDADLLREIKIFQLSSETGEETKTLEEISLMLLKQGLEQVQMKKAG